MSLEQYITCRDNCSLRHVESLAMIGLADRAEVQDCDKRNFKRIILHLVGGLTVTSSCFYYEEVEQSLKIINTYIQIARREGSVGKLTIIEPREEQYRDQ
ncbi:MAG: hypothetical protein LM557_00380 [Desulfurococcaceae archaeon]|nr:hypothetical protein [Desulfurococcaceae archaeon]MCC6053563.1 hypothetical protein [Desulfurococcaceae archaeon]